VRDIAQQPGEGAPIGAQSIGHGVEFAREHRDLVFAAFEARAHAHVEALAGEGACALLHAPDRCGKVLREPPACERAYHERDAEDARRYPGQAQRAEDARTARHQQHRVRRAIGRHDLRQHALWAEVTGREASRSQSAGAAWWAGVRRHPARRFGAWRFGAWR
jgi:hypothetical protein